MKCPTGTYCKDGKCTTNISVCPTKAPYQTTVCTDPRPDENTCPVVNYIRAPDPVVCGVKADGSRFSFARECSACKDQEIVYYFDKPCHKVPFVCNSADRCLDYYCSSPICSNDEECPYDW